MAQKRTGEKVHVDAGYVTPGRVSYGVRLQKIVLSAVLASIISIGVSVASSAESLPEPTIKAVINRVLDESGEFSQLSPNEMELFRLINGYRESQGLPAIANSRSLNKVARIHAIDLSENSPAKDHDSRDLDCSLHSWSDKGAWKQVCYTSDHAYAEGMWDKPREITRFTYKGDGYEIAYSTGEQEVTPAKVLEAWKASPSHNAILVESGVWKGKKLLAFGVGIYKNNAVIWVGTVVDPLGPMQVN
ncbi:MAG: CAP domain-containing protein [Desulfuromonadaceae bacterium]